MVMMMMKKTVVFVWLAFCCGISEAFMVRTPLQHHHSPTQQQHQLLRRSSATTVLLQATATNSTSIEGFVETVAKKVIPAKTQLLGLLDRLGPGGIEDSVLADPFTKEPIRISSPGALLANQQRLGGGGVTNIRYILKSPSNIFEGNSNGFLNLLEPIERNISSTTATVADNYYNYDNTVFADRSEQRSFLRDLTPFIPPPIRSALATAGLDMGDDYIPMRDLFTSPAVSFAYERGWRQNFASAGFPGVEKEARLAMIYFAPAFDLDYDEKSTKRDSPATLVDMSCATGLFTRRFAKSRKYDRVIGCDYSASMLNEARRRIQSDPDLAKPSSRTRLDLVKCDVGRIPMKTNSVNALHAGAAMHCWPDLPAAVREISRVLKPGGRYFATTFLSSWFGSLQDMEGGRTGPSRQAFQYFESVYQLRNLLELYGGFDKDKISVKVLGRACVVIECEKSIPDDGRRSSTNTKYY